jgi:L-fuculose-phosphate aldolase
VLLAAERAELVHYCRRFVADGLVMGTSGNVSIRSGDLVAITPRRKVYADVSPEEMCVIDLSGESIEADCEPSSEVPLHLTIYRRTAATAIVHTHSKFATVLSTLVDELCAIHYMIASLGGPIRVAAYATYGTEELGENVVPCLQDRSAVLLQNHGAVTVGTTLKQAYDRSLTLEWLSELYYRARLFGEPSILADDEIARVQDKMASSSYNATADSESSL